MQPAGLRAYELRTANRSGIYAYEQRSAELIEPYLGKLKRNKAAWKFFAAQPPGYRKIMNWFIVSAKQEETRLKRLAILIEAFGKRKAPQINPGYGDRDVFTPGQDVYRTSISYKVSG